MVYFSLCFFFSYAWEEEDAIVFFFHFFVSIWNEEGDSTNVPLPFFLLLFFVTNKVTKTSLLPSQNFPLLPTYPPSYLLPTYLPTYLTSFSIHFIVKAHERLKQEGKRGREKLRTRSGRAEVATKKKHLKWKGKSKREKLRAKSRRAKL